MSDPFQQRSTLDTSGIIAIYGTGGTGATTFALNLASTLTRIAKEHLTEFKTPGLVHIIPTEAILVDADYRWGTIGNMLGPLPTRGIFDACINGKEALDPTTIILGLSDVTDRGLIVLNAPARLTDAALIETKTFIQMLRLLANHCRYVIVDVGRELDDKTLAIFNISDLVIPVLGTTYIDFTRAKKMMQFLSIAWADEISKMMFALNRINPEEQRQSVRISVEQMEKYLKQSMSFHISDFLTAPLKAAMQRIPLIDDETATANEEFQSIANVIMARLPPRPPSHA